MRTLIRYALPLVLFAAACEDPQVTDPVTTPTAEQTIARSGPGLYPLFARSAKYKNALDTVIIDVYIKDVSVDASIGSYQGEITYDKSVLHFIDATGPAGVLSAWNQTGEGVIKVAGASAEGLPKGTALLSMRFTQRGKIKPDAFAFKLDEVVQQNTFSSLTSKVTKSAALFSETPITTPDNDN